MRSSGDFKASFFGGGRLFMVGLSVVDENDGCIDGPEVGDCCERYA